MKKIALIVAAMLLVTVVFTACAKKEEPAPQTEPAVVGGWTLNTDETKGMLDEDAQKAFDKALEGYAGMGFEPIALLGTQVVAGTNYLILCRGTTVTAKPETKLVTVKVYAKLDGNAEILEVKDFDLGAIEQIEDGKGTEKGLAGGWNIPLDYKVVNLPAEAAKAFDGAMDGFTGANYEPMALLGTKVIAGVEYAILCHQTLVTANPESNVAVVYVCGMADGTNEIKNIVPLNLAE